MHEHHQSRGMTFQVWMGYQHKIANVWKYGPNFYLCVTSLLNFETLHVACVIPSSAATQAEQRKHHSNDEKCGELGWVCIPLVEESYGSWGSEAQRSLSRLAGRLATRLWQPKSFTTNLIYGRLNLTLIRANSWAILFRACV